MRALRVRGDLWRRTLLSREGCRYAAVHVEDVARALARPSRAGEEQYSPRDVLRQDVHTERCALPVELFELLEGRAVRPGPLLSSGGALDLRPLQHCVRVHCVDAETPRATVSEALPRKLPVLSAADHVRCVRVSVVHVGVGHKGVQQGLDRGARHRGAHLTAGELGTISSSLIYWRSTPSRLERYTKPSSADKSSALPASHLSVTNLAGLAFMPMAIPASCRMFSAYLYLWCPIEWACDS